MSKSRFEVGKDYKTRSGKTIRILTVDSTAPLFPIIGMELASGAPITYTAGGRYSHRADEFVTRWDLVPEPRSFEVTVFLTEEQDGTLGASFSPLPPYDGNVIGKQTVTLTEKLS